MDSSSIPAVPFFARTSELRQLSQFLERACTGEGKVIFLHGTPGSGKTTLLREFVRRAGADDNLIVLTTACTEHIGPADPYRPFLTLLHQLIDPPSHSLTNQSPRRSEQVFSDIIHALVEQGPDLVDLLSPDDLARARAHAVLPNNTAWLNPLERTRSSQTAPTETRIQEIELSDQLARTFQTIAQQHPLLVVIDDLQWADSASISLLFHLGQELSDHAVLMVGAYHGESIAAGRDGKPHPLQSVLQEWQRDQRNVEINLDNADGHLFVNEYLDSEPNHLGQTCRDSIHLHTRGHPLYTIQLVRRLREQGDLQQDETGAWIESPSLQWTNLPQSLDAVVVERLAQLPADLQNLLMVASIAGEVFSPQTIAHAQEIDLAVVVEQLDTLEKQYQLIGVWDHERRYAQYRFAHDVFRRSLYKNIDPLKRARLHQAVGHALEKNYLGQNDSTDLAAQLAWHFEEAAYASQAARYTLHAGRRAYRLSAYAEALALFRRGLQWLQVLPHTLERDEKELELRMALHGPLAQLHGYSSIELRQSIEQLQEICDQAGEIAAVIPALLHLADFFNLRSELDAGNKVAQRALDMAFRFGDTELVTWARQNLALNLFYRGDLVASRQQWEQSETLESALPAFSPSVRGIDARVAARSWNAQVFWLLGYPDKANQLAQDAIRIAQNLNHPASLAAAWIGRATLDIFGQDYKALPERITTVRQLADKYELASEQAVANIYHGRLLAKLGRVQDGIQMMYRGLAARQALGLASGESFYMGLLADTYNAANRRKHAQHALSEAITSARETGERLWEAELYRQVGEALAPDEPQPQQSRGLFQSFAKRVRRPSWDNVELDELLNLPWDDPGRPSAEYCFERAIQAADKQQAKSLELRATVSLCRLWMRQDRHRQAQPKLAALYKWFSEGFETLDLKDAKALLNSLSE